MKISRHSLTEDAVDRYNHSWGVALLLTISATAWLIPQIVYVHQTITGRNVQTYTAKCFTPAQFTSAMVAYAASSCAAAFNNAVQNVEEESNETFQAAIVYQHVENPASGGPFTPSESTRFKPVASDETQPIYLRTCLVTFILAVCLKLPYILWSLLSSFSDAGPSQILRSIQAVQFMDAAVRNQTSQEIIETISSCKQKQSFFNSLLYLSFKLLTVSTALVGFFVVRFQFLSSSTFGNRADVSVAKTVNDYSNTALFCHFEINRSQNIHVYTVQCVFEPDSFSRQSVMSPNSAEHDFVYVQLFVVLHTLLEYFFAVLATINGVDFLAWVVKLAPGPFRNRSFLNSKLPLDIYLLLLMARQNIGFVAAKNLELGFSSELGGEAKSREELRKLAE